MSLRAECLASLRQHSDTCAVLTTNAGSGPRLSEWSASCDPHSQCLRTRQASLFCQNSTESLESLPRSGMICGGMLYPLPPLVLDISGNARSSCLPTPRMQEAGSRPNGKGGKILFEEVLIAAGLRQCGQLLPTPTTRDWKDTPGMNMRVCAASGSPGRNRQDQLPRRLFAEESTAPTGGVKLTPEFLCWLMGFPPDWLKPLANAPGMRCFPKSLPFLPKPSENTYEQRDGDLL